jgi:hypothetical protein
VDRRAAEHVVGANEHGAFRGADAEPLEQRPTLRVCVDVVPAERDQVALQQFADGERLAGRAPPDQPFVAEALASQPLTTGDHGPQEQVSQLVGAGDQRAQRVGWYREQLGLLGGDAAGNCRLAGEHGDVGGEGARLALREVAIALGLAIDDVDGSREHDVQGRIALTLFEDDFARRERQGLGALGQPLDLSLCQAREQGRIARIQEALGRGR